MAVVYWVTCLYGHGRRRSSKSSFHGALSSFAGIENEEMIIRASKFICKIYDPSMTALAIYYRKFSQAGFFIGMFLAITDLFPSEVIGWSVFAVIFVLCMWGMYASWLINAELHNLDRRKARLLRRLARKTRNTNSLYFQILVRLSYSSAMPERERCLIRQIFAEV